MSIRPTRISKTTRSASPAPVAATPTPSTADKAPSNVEKAPQSAEQGKTGPVISAARIRKSIDKYGVNKAVEDEIKLLAPLVHEYKKDKFIVSGKVQFGRKDEDVAPPSAEEVAASQKRLDSRTKEEKNADATIDLLTAERVRFSKDAATALGHILDNLVSSIAHKIVELGREDKLKLIRSSILHNPRMREVPGFNSLTVLPAFIARDAEEQAHKIQQAKNAAAAAAVEEFKVLLKELTTDSKAKLKAANALPQLSKDIAALFDAAKLKVAAIAPAAEETEEATTASSDIPDKSFDFYVGVIFKDIIKAEFRVTTEVKQYIGTLISEFIGKVAQFLNVQIESGQIRTISKDAVVDAAKLLMTNMSRVSSTVKVQQLSVTDDAALDAERKKKTEARKNGGKYEYDVNSLPKVKKLVAVKTLNYDECGWNALNK